MRSYRITPPVVSAETMKGDTVEALKSLAAITGGPTGVSIGIALHGEHQYKLCAPDLFTPGNVAGEILPLSTVNGAFGREAANLTIQPLLDPKVELFLHQCLQNDDIRSSISSSTLLIMPGVIRIGEWNPAEEADCCRNLLSENSSARMTVDHFAFHGFGVFAAGKYDSAHSRMEAQQRIRDTQDVWGVIHQRHNSPLPGNSGFELASPKVGADPQVEDIGPYQGDAAKMMCEEML